MADQVMVALVIRAQKKDQHAMAEIFDLVKSKLFHFCFNLCGNRQLAEDLCQEAFVKAFSHVETLKDPAHFHSWLYQIARNHFFDEVRKPSNAHEEPTEDLEKVGDPGHTSSQPPTEQNLAVREALLRLDPKDREVLVLVDIEEYSYQEAAEIVGITENALRSRIHRARQSFLSIFKEA